MQLTTLFSLKCLSQCSAKVGGCFCNHFLRFHGCEKKLNPFHFVGRGSEIKKEKELKKVFGYFRQTLLLMI